MLPGAWTSSHPVHLSCWALGTMRGSTTTRTLTALLCLGELYGKEEGMGPLPFQVLVPKRPQDSGGSVGTAFPGENETCQPKV